MGVGPLLSIPGFSPQRSGTVGHVTPERTTEQSILKIAESTRESQRQQNVLPAKSPSGQLWGSAAAAGAPPMSSQPAQRKAVGVGPLLSMPAIAWFFSVKVRHSRTRNTRDGYGTDSYSARSILKIRGRSRKSQRQQHVLSAKPQS